MDKLIEEYIMKIIEGTELKYELLSNKSLERIRRATKLLLSIEEENKKYFNAMKSNKLSISFFSQNNEMGLSRRTIYADRDLLIYLNTCIEMQADYFNNNKISKLEENMRKMEHEYNAILNNIIDIFDMKNEIKVYKKRLEQLEKEKILMYNKILEQEKTILNLNSKRKSDKIIKLKEI